ncbi:uncharacterized protein LOC135089258 [Scylla paramamosain]|uniref:uncharacterized protein LOC135089258 n=1 Tax=Scylla paramamosain TaxID=85552 RepID=UPI0030836253
MISTRKILRRILYISHAELTSVELHYRREECITDKPIRHCCCGALLDKSRREGSGRQGSLVCARQSAILQAVAEYRRKYTPTLNEEDEDRLRQMCQVVGPISNKSGSSNNYSSCNDPFQAEVHRSSSNHSSGSCLCRRHLENSAPALPPPSGQDCYR